VIYKITIERIDELDSPEQITENSTGSISKSYTPQKHQVHRPVYMQVFEDMDLNDIIKRLNGVYRKKRRK
jgi:hypothetical protein